MKLTRRNFKKEIKRIWGDDLKNDYAVKANLSFQNGDCFYMCTPFTRERELFLRDNISRLEYIYRVVYTMCAKQLVKNGGNLQKLLSELQGKILYL